MSEKRVDRRVMRTPEQQALAVESLAVFLQNASTKGVAKGEIDIEELKLRFDASALPHFFDKSESFEQDYIAGKYPMEVEQVSYENTTAIVARVNNQIAVIFDDTQKGFENTKDGGDAASNLKFFRMPHPNGGEVGKGGYLDLHSGAPGQPDVMERTTQKILDIAARGGSYDMHVFGNSRGGTNATMAIELTTALEKQEGVDVSLVSLTNFGGAPAGNADYASYVNEYAKRSGVSVQTVMHDNDITPQMPGTHPGDIVFISDEGRAYFNPSDRLLSELRYGEHKSEFPLANLISDHNKSYEVISAMTQADVVPDKLTSSLGSTLKGHDHDNLLDIDFSWNDVQEEAEALMNLSPDAASSEPSTSFSMSQRASNASQNIK